MFEIEIAECKGAKEALKSQLDETVKHLEEYFDTLFGEEERETLSQDVDNLKVSVSAFRASLAHLVEEMKRVSEQCEEEK